MKKVMLFAGMVLFMFTVGAAHAAGNPPERAKTQGNLVQANTFSVDESGCVDTYTGVSVDVSDQGGVPKATGWVYIDQYNACLGESIEFLYGSADVTDYAVGKRLEGASASFAVDGYRYSMADQTETPVTLTVDIDLAATAKRTYRERVNYSYDAECDSARFRFDTTSRKAAGSLAVTVDNDPAVTLNATGMIAATHSGSVIRTKRECGA